MTNAADTRCAAEVPVQILSENLREISQILAIGVLRLHTRGILAANPAEKLPDSASPSLEVSPETVLSVHTS
jgi:hypothetical protein